MKQNERRYLRRVVVSLLGAIIGIGLGLAFMHLFTAMPGDGRDHGLLGWILIIPLGAFWILSLFPFGMLAGMLELPETPATFVGIYGLTGLLWTYVACGVIADARKRNANQASEATSKTAPSAVSEPPQGRRS